MRNAEVATLLYNISELLEIKGEITFKIRAYAKAARAIEGNTEDIEKIAREKRLKEIPGVGEKIAEKIEEYLETGKLESYEDLKKQVPKELHELLKIPGIGPKTLQFLHGEIGIKSVEDLEKAAREHRLRRLERFGATKEENIIKAIERYRQRSSRIPLGTALPLVREIIEALAKSGFIETIEPAGSLRRKKETVGDIDILAISKDALAAIEAFVHLPAVKEVIVKGPTKATVITHEAIQVDLRIMESRSFGTSLQYFTGSKEHNIKLRDLARQKGLKLSEYDLEEISTGKKIYCGSDDEVYNKLGLAPIPPEIREDTGEIEAALGGKLPMLVENKDIKGDFHIHTDWSEGTNTLAEMVEAAKKLGYEYIAVTDHSKAIGVAHGLSEERLLAQIDEIQKLNRKLENFRVFTGIEVDIKADSSLNFPDSILRQCDVVVAALHTGQRQTRREITGRLITAMENENVDIIAHPTGRIIGEREAYDVDIDALLDAAAGSHTVLEINAYPSRLDLSDVNARKAKNKGIKIAIGTDAHNIGHLGLMEFGVNVARRAWLEKKDVMNTRAAEDVKFKD
ncbi:MAG: DNA polymerase/3'-5' exonuclease PolX [Candidatus Methanoperedens sp.]|nr:DNA polymerase/3'-5' exonuclease PolX [Candidatus Methanoperedens sp.]MCZ7371419.1 DNA polymerase/3'-5' exonuclease PolX [Candidatus Methanoperedens sp.]